MNKKLQNLLLTPIFLVCLLTNNLLFADQSKTESFIDANQSIPIIVTSTKPIYNLTAGILKDITLPELLIKGNSSPHDFSLKPSDVTLVNRADVLIWGGENIEPFLEKMIKTTDIPLEINITKANELTILPIRNKTFFSDGSNHDHHNCPGHHSDHNNKDLHNHNENFNDFNDVKEHKNEHSNTHKHDNSDKHIHDHNKEAFDPHVWLSPTNAIKIVDYISEQIAEKYPEYKSQITKNSSELKEKINNKQKELTKKLAKLENQHFLVFHDAYQYFEKDYNLKSLGAISINPHIPLSAKKINALNKCLKSKEVKCIFTEPQFKFKYMEQIRNDVNHAELDPLGSDKDLGPDGYIKLIDNLGNNFYQCLK